MPKGISFELAGDAIIEMAGKLIDANHEHLSAAKIVYLFQEKATVSKGKAIAGKAVKPNKREQFLHGWDFEIILAEDIWSILNEGQRLYVLDHELRHCIMNDKGSWDLAPHDYEDFRDILERHKDVAIGMDNILAKYLNERNAIEE